MGTIQVIKKFIESNWIIEKAVRGVLEHLPLRFRYGISYGPTFRYWLAFLKESENWDRDRLEAYQVEQLRDLLTHAGSNVPYYRRIFGEYGFRPQKLQGLEDLKTLPYIDKEIIRDNISEFLANNIARKTLFRKNTSGSTGIPLAIYSNKEAEEKHWATVVHAWSKIGYTIKSKMVTFWGIIPK
jgi:phenylacetate-CoA ligase